MSTGVGVSDCCLSGKIHSGQPKGRVEQIAGLSTYVSEPEGGSKTMTVVFLVDIFGYELPNIRLLADVYANAGFTVYIPDVHEGDSLHPDFLQTVEPQLPDREKMGMAEKAAATAKTGATLGPWLITHREAVARPLIEDFIDKVRFIPGTHKVGAIGFCWGGRYSVLSGQKPFSTGEGKGVDAVVACHPSLVSIPSDFQDVCVPMSLALGDQDSLLGQKEIGQLKELLQKKSEGADGMPKIETEVKVYEDQVHGFALRGDWSSEKDKKAMDQATMQGIEWFRKHLSGE